MFDAREWTERLGQPMHEVLIKTNGHNFQLVFHDVSIHKIAQGDPETNILTPTEDDGTNAGHRH